MTLLRFFKSALAQPFNFCLLSLSLSALGCNAGSSANAPMTGPQLRGSVHGGQQPVAGATIQLYAAGTSGYGAGAVPLLSTPVLSDVNGAFSITGQYTCPSSSSQLYIVATGGNPGLSTPTNNTSLALMAALGPCSLHGSQYTLDPNAFISINEVTTVASVYALAGFMDQTSSQIGASATNSIGIANAFQTVSNLVNIATGQSLTTTPAGNGTVPQAEINTLADIIAACVNSAGSGPECAALFTAATPPGGSAPTNTLQAIFNIATHPSQQVGALYALFSPTSPFQPTLPSAPNDWTVTVHYTGHRINRTTGVSIDSLGNVWIANDPGNVVSGAAMEPTFQGQQDLPAAESADLEAWRSTYGQRLGCQLLRKQCHPVKQLRIDTLRSKRFHQRHQWGQWTDLRGHRRHRKCLDHQPDLPRLHRDQTRQRRIPDRRLHLSLPHRLDLPARRPSPDRHRHLRKRLDR